MSSDQLHTNKPSPPADGKVLRMALKCVEVRLCVLSRHETLVLCVLLGGETLVLCVLFGGETLVLCVCVCVLFGGGTLVLSVCLEERH